MKSFRAREANEFDDTIDLPTHYALGVVAKRGQGSHLAAVLNTTRGFFGVPTLSATESCDHLACRARRVILFFQLAAVPWKGQCFHVIITGLPLRPESPALEDLHGTWRSGEVS